MIRASTTLNPSIEEQGATECTVVLCRLEERNPDSYLVEKLVRGSSRLSSGPRVLELDTSTSLARSVPCGVRLTNRLLEHPLGIHGIPRRPNCDSQLREQGVTTLVITGTMTDICVLATVVGAFNREYRITVVEDAVSTLWPEIQRATLDIIGRAFGRVVSSKTVVDTLTTWR